MHSVHNSSYKDGQLVGGRGPDCMYTMKTDSPMGVNGNEAEGDASDYQEHSFAEGDLVWVKMKTDLCWPGMICDPYASKDAGKCDQRDGFFVKNFVNTTTVWCRPFQLKPFVEYFELMSRQNKSRSFYGAIENALSEFGRRVKQKMTCSCFSKENHVAALNFPKEDGSRGSVFSASQFDPSNFLKFIRLRALGFGGSGSIEFIIIENCLLAFYTSTGHKQLPLYKLRPLNSLIPVIKDEDLDKLSSGDSVLKCCGNGSDDCKMTEMELSGSLESPRGTRSMISRSKIANENVEGKSEKGFESRERKQSKYLSYPYVHSWAPRKNSPGKGEDETEGCEEVSLGGLKSSSNPSMVSNPIGNNSNKNTQRKSRKFVIDNGICNNADLTAAASAEILQELHQTALDCFFTIQSKCSVPIRDFYLSFRAFRDPIVQMDKDREAAVHNEIGAIAAVVHNEIGVLGGLPDLNGNNAGLSVENMQVIGPALTHRLVTRGMWSSTR